MIPESMLAGNPELRNKVLELVQKKMCRFCLSETEYLVDIVEDGGKKGLTTTNWKMILTSSMSVCSMIDEKLPKYVCDRCCEFVKKCYEFQKLRRKAELLLLTYPLTGSWSQNLDVPEWLLPVKKRRLVDEVEDPLPVKKVCVDVAKNSEEKSNPANRITMEELSDPENTAAGSIRVRSQESLAIQSSIQSPTITSENTQPSLVPQSVAPNQNNLNAVPSINQKSLPCFDLNCSVIQYCQSQHIQHHNQSTSYQTSNNSMRPVNLPTTSYPQYQPPSSSVQSTVQTSKPQVVAANPILHNQLQKPPQSLPYQPASNVTTALYQPPTTTSNQLTTYQQPHQQHQQQQRQPPAYTSSLQCSNCSYIFANPNHLIYHMRKHNGYAQFTCTEGCSERFLWLNAFVDHLERNHLSTRVCFLCGALEDGDWQLLRHLQEHRAARLTQACDFCALVFANRFDRLRHVKLVHQQDVRQVWPLNPTGSAALEGDKRGN